MPDVLATATLASRDGLSENDVVNTFAFSMPSGFESSSTQIDDLADAISDFYSVTAPSAANPLSDWLAPSLSRTVAPVIRFYNITGHLDGSPHGSPFAERNGGLLTAPDIDVSLPAEVAAVLTLRGNGWESAAVETPDGADAGSAVDRPRQRKTGRIYVGPLNQAALAMDATTKITRLAPQFQEDLLRAAVQLGTEVKTVVSGARWCVWSRVDTFLYTITDVQVDNAFDTQRRRGQDPTTRGSYPIP